MILNYIRFKKKISLLIHHKCSRINTSFLKHNSVLHPLTSSSSRVRKLKLMRILFILKQISIKIQKLVLLKRVILHAVAFAAPAGLLKVSNWWCTIRYLVWPAHSLRMQLFYQNRSCCSMIGCPKELVVMTEKKVLIGTIVRKF